MSGALAALVWLAACDGFKRVAAVEVTAPSAEMWADQALQLTAVARDGAGQPLPGRELIWRSEDPTVARVDAAGLVTGVSVGTATIVAASEGVQGRLRLFVRSRELVAVEVTAPSTDMLAGQTLQLTALARDGAGQPLSGREFTWRSEDPTVARVDAAGLVTGVTVGTATIVAASEAIQARLRINVRSQGLETVEVTAPTADVWADQTLQLTAVGRDGVGQSLSGREFTWRSEDPTVARVDAAGLVTGVTVGAATIVAASEGKEGRLDVYVRSRVHMVFVWAFDYWPGGRPYLPALAVGRTLQLWAEAVDSSYNEIPGSMTGMRWSISDPTVASIVPSGAGGLVTALAPGRVTVTATFEGVRMDFPLVVGKGFTITELPGWSLFGMSVTNLNEHGHVVGSIEGRAFLWQGGPVVDLGIPESAALDVNDLGQVVGSFNSKPHTIPDLIHPFLWQAGQAIDLAPGVQEHTHAIAINEQGEVVGYTAARGTTSGEPARAVVWRNGQMNNLGSLGGYAAYALDISSQGDIVGFRTLSGGSAVPILLRDGQLSDLPVQAGSGRAVAVSEDGAVAGNVGDTAFLWQDGAVTYIPPDFDTAIRVSDVNRLGQAVGYAGPRSGRPVHEPRAVLWVDGTALDLSGLVAEPGWTLVNARAINDRGQIAVQLSRSGISKGALLTPVP